MCENNNKNYLFLLYYNLLEVDIEPFTVTISADKSLYETNDDILIELHVINHLDKNISMTFGYPHFSDFEILNDKGNQVYLWSKDKAFPTVVSEWGIKAKETKVLKNVTINPSKDKYWTGPVSEGLYTVRGWFRSYPRLYSNLSVIEISSTKDRLLLDRYPKKSTGIQIIYSDNNDIVNNSCYISQKDGISIFFSNSNNINNNTIFSNENIGIRSIQSNNNWIYKNMLISNKDQAMDNGTNYWNNSKKLGNYWSDYELRYPKASNDGIVWDTPYEISGKSGAKDYYPLVENTSKIPNYQRPIAKIEFIKPNPCGFGKEVKFKGIGIDRDGKIIAYRWYSDLDGLLSSNSSFNSTTLSQGNHKISFYVQDNDGLWSTEDFKVLNIIRNQFEGNYTLHEPIEIIGNDNFTLENGVVSGTGIKEDPFIIEGWEFNGSAGYCIYIKNTSAKFRIRNCYFHHQAGLEVLLRSGDIVWPRENYRFALYINNVSSGSIENVTFSRNEFTMKIIDSENIYLINSTFLENNYGIKISDSNSINIIYNWFDSCFRTGIEIYNSNNNSILDNYLGNLIPEGIYLYKSNNNTINGNFCLKGEKGITLSHSINNSLRMNICESNYNYGIGVFNSHLNRFISNACNSNTFDGFDISKSNYNLFENNLCRYNGLKGIELEKSSNNKFFENFFESNAFSMIDSTMNEFENNTLEKCGLIIKGNKLEYYNTNEIDSTNTINSKNVFYWSNRTSGTVPPQAGQIILANCSNIIVENQTISKVDVGIILAFSSNCSIKNVNCTTFSNTGITLQNSTYNKIIGNIFNSNNSLRQGTGIYLRESSSSNTIDNNKCTNCYAGIYLMLSTSKNCIQNNNCSKNYQGIYLDHNSNGNTISNNNLQSAKQDIESSQSISCLKKTSKSVAHTAPSLIITELSIGNFLPFTIFFAFFKTSSNYFRKICITPSLNKLNVKTIKLLQNAEIT